MNDKVEVFEEGEKVFLVIKGVFVYGSLFFKGENVILYMFDILDEFWIKEDDFRRFIDFYNIYIGFDVFGEKFLIGFEDEKFGKFVLNVGMICKEKGRFVFIINVRYLVDILYDEIEKKVKEVV